MHPTKTEALCVLIKLADSYEKDRIILACCAGRYSGVEAWCCNDCILDTPDSSNRSDRCFSFSTKEKLVGLAFLATIPGDIRKSIIKEVKNENKIPQSW